MSRKRFSPEQIVNELREADVYDARLLEATIEVVVIDRPEAEEVEPHLRLDKGYDNPTGQQAVLNGGYIPHIRRIGEEKFDDKKRQKHPPRRWVVERIIAWLNSCRAILVRYAKKSSNHLGWIQVACILLRYRRTWRLNHLR